MGGVDEREWQCPKCGALADERWDCCEVHEETRMDDARLAAKPQIATLVLDYFPDALAAVARVSAAGNAQHGTVGWDKSKSADEDNSLVRHFLKRGDFDTDGMRHSAKVAWRALALLQREIEASK